MGMVEEAPRECDWMRAHDALSRLARRRAAADAEEGRWLLCALRTAAHVHLGHASFSQYIERLLGHSPRTTQERLRVAEALEGLPELARALDAGALSWCAARELTRVAVPETERAWLTFAAGKTIRQLEELVANRNPGAAPDAPARQLPRRRVLRFEVAPETFASFREAMLELRRSAGSGLDDDAVLLSMARHVLGGPQDDGRASYQVSLTVCATCASGEQLSSGERIPVGDEMVSMAQCDAQNIGQLLPHGGHENASPNAAAANSVELEASHSATTCDDDTHSTRNARDAHVAATHPGNSARAAGDCDSTRRAATARTRPTPRATQSIPPAVRRAVLVRDQRRCRVPGCTHATFVDVHHIEPRFEGGGHDPDNLITLCSAHHRATHRGELVLEPHRTDPPTFRHADGTAYGQAVASRLVDAHTKVSSALHQLGFREREIRAVLTELRTDAALGDSTPERLLREALCRIRRAWP